MARLAHRHGFSLIELLVALSILAVVAAIIVPQFLNLRTQAQTTIAQDKAAEITNTYNTWVALGGHRATNPDQYEQFRILQFLCSTTNLGIDAKRGFVDPTGIYPTDSLGSMGSYTAVLPSNLIGNTDPTVAPAAASDPNGYYGAKPIGSNITGSLVNAPIYEKQDSQIYAINSDLATAVFIRTGVAVGLMH